MPAGNDGDRHVQPNQERSGWDVIKEPHESASQHFAIREEAINHAREIITNLGGGELRVKNERGEFIDSDTITGAKHQGARHLTSSRRRLPYADCCFASMR
jgi:Uncharacterized protein conserved in bacteria (DUF2188)